MRLIPERSTFCFIPKAPNHQVALRQTPFLPVGECHEIFDGLEQEVVGTCYKETRNDVRCRYEQHEPKIDGEFF